MIEKSAGLKDNFKGIKCFTVIFRLRSRFYYVICFNKNFYVIQIRMAKQVRYHKKIYKISPDFKMKHFAFMD